MTDLLDLQLTMDTRQFVAGGRAAASALDDVSRKTQQASDAQLRFEGNVGRLYSRGGALGGVLQVSQGVGNLTTQLARGSVEAAAFSAAFLAMEVGKTAQDFHEVTDAVAGATRQVTVATVEYDALGVAITRTSTVAQVAAATGFQKFLFVLKANPLLAAVAALSAIATVVQLIGNNADKSAQQMQQLGEAGNAIANRRKVVGGFGEQTTLSLLQQEQGRLPDIAAQLTASGKAVSAEEMSKIMGITVEQLAAKLEQFGTGRIAPNGQGSEYLRLFSNDPGIRIRGQASTDETLGGGANPVFKQGRTPYDVAVGRNVEFSPDAATRFLENEYKRLEALIKPPSTVDNMAALDGKGYGDFGFSRTSLAYANPVVRKEAEWQKQQVKEQEAVDRWKQGLEEMRAIASGVGEQLGSGILDAIQGLRTGKDLLASMVNDIERMALSKTTGAAFSAVGAAASKLFNSAPSSAALDRADTTDI
jgi:hypothetical protein